MIDTALVPDGAQEQLAEAASSLCALANTDPRAALEEFVRLAEAAASEAAGLQLPQLVPLLAMLYSLIGSEGFVPQPPAAARDASPAHPLPPGRPPPRFSAHAHLLPRPLRAQAQAQAQQWQRRVCGRARGRRWRSNCC